MENETPNDTDKMTGKCLVFYFDPEFNLIKTSEPIATYQHAQIKCKQFARDNLNYSATVVRILYTTEEPQRKKWEFLSNPAGNKTSSMNSYTPNTGI